MSFANPTPIKLGMTGTFNERTFRVAGRVVMGMEEDGETYYWNEFNLVSDAGESATLVYEETERGGEWRLFTLFEVEYPLSAEEAATKRVGDPINLDDREVCVTLVDESRVYFIEGEAPEGVETGDVANYFNAEDGEYMIVVSWTGDEVEYYRGVTLSAQTIATVFSFPADQFRDSPGARSSALLEGTSFGDSAQYLSGAKFFKLVVLVLGAAVLVAIFVNRQASRARTVPRIAAPATTLRVGQAGLLDGTRIHLVSHALVEVAEVGRIHDRHEFQGRDDSGQVMLLVSGLNPGQKDWFCFTTLEPSEPLTPVTAARLKAGDSLSVDGHVGPVTDVAQMVFRQMEGDDPEGAKAGTIAYGFNIQKGNTPVLVRWNQQGIHFYRGRLISAQELETAFGIAAKK